MSHTVYFHHIPKTAGSTVSHWLGAQPGLVRAPAHLWSQLLKLPSSSLDAYTLYSGHFYRPLHRYLCRDLDVIVFLRNPIDRSISHFEHVRRATDHYFYERVQRHNSFLEFICDPLTRPLVENFQVRCIATQFNPASLAEGMLENAGSPFALERAIETLGMQGCEETALLAAKDYLMRARAIGLTEQTDRSIELVASAFGWPVPGRQERINVAPSRSVTALRMSDRELDAVIAATRLDWLLYEFACDLFERQVRRAESRAPKSQSKG